MAIEKFLAMEDGEPGYTKLGTVTHVPFPAGGNGVQMARTGPADDIAWALPNRVEVAVAPASDYFIEFTSDSVWAVAFRDTAGWAIEVRANNSGVITAKWDWNGQFASVTTGVEMGATHRWGVTGGLDVAGGGRRFAVWCDGVEVAVGSAAGVGTAKVNQIILTYNFDVTTSPARFDSVVISDAPQGDCHVDYLVPDGNGDTSQWVGSDSDSVDNWALVDETPPSGADYVEADATDLRDLYTVANLPASGTILGVQAIVHPWKLGPGAEIPTSTILKTGAGEHVDLIEGMSTAMQGLETPIRTTRPGGGEWTVADVNAMQIGVTTEEP